MRLNFDGTALVITILVGNAFIFFMMKDIKTLIFLRNFYFPIVLTSLNVELIVNILKNKKDLEGTK